MELFINKLISAVITDISVLIFILIIWVIFGRKKQSFFDWYGIKGFRNKNKIYIWIVGLSIIFSGIGIFVLYLFIRIETAVSSFNGLGIYALAAIIVYATLGTSIPEELMFRAFALKRLEAKLSFMTANIIQALLFASLHGLVFLFIIGIVKALTLFVFTGLIAFLMGYINEEKADGSILPSIIIHSVSNMLAGICVAWSLI